MQKVIALNSGGFDSICMIHELVNNEIEPISVFFNWGQPNLIQERKCAETIADKYNLEHIEVPIFMPWVDTNMDNKVYIPMRNLVFSSYAISLAEQRGIQEVYMAIIDNNSDTPFIDCTPEFYDTLEDLIADTGIRVKTPYINHRKVDLVYKAFEYDIKEDEFFSCNHPTKDLKSCGKCGDCLALQDVMEQKQALIDYNKAWNSKDLTSEEFRKAYMGIYIDEVRLLINNECQFKCKHCFYGFDDEIGTRLTNEEFKKVIQEAYTDFGASNIHISGKEPLMNDNIFELTNFMDTFRNKTYDIVTNGVNIPKYINNLKECKNLRFIYLSVDNLEDTQVRPTGNHILNNVKLLLDNNINVKCTIDVHKDNITHVKDIILNLVNWGVKEIYVRAIKPIGQGESMRDKIVTPNEYAELLKELYSLDDMADDITIQMSWNKDNYHNTTDEFANELLEYTKRTGVDFLTNNLRVGIQNYCTRYSTQITVTSDGYVLGCGSEMSCANYDKIATGNVRENSIRECLYKGRTSHLDKNIHLSCTKGCPIGIF